MSEQFVKRFIFRRNWFQLARPLTLSASLGPMIVGFLLANRSLDLDYLLLMMFLVTGLFMQSSVNMLNDYFDFRSGQDVNRWFYSYKRHKSCPTLEQIPWVALILVGIGSLITLYMATMTTYFIIVVGIIGLGIGVWYSASPYSLAALGLGEVAGAISLGFLPVAIAFLLSDQLIWSEVLFVSFPFIALMVTMVLSNNLRDLEKDKGFRKTLPMRIGEKRGVVLLAIFLTLPYLFLIVFHLTFATSYFGVIAFIPMLLAFKVFSLFKSYEPKEKVKGMQWAGYHHWTFSTSLIVWIVLELVF
ncbi:prenyltransferase [Alkalibacillus aidingensis]|uniref:prenyltransferase n=1 Tax=Alkalibacillus aidingensis TaxID=2747607 RepID=UPI00166112E1|nr:prenyltransferase [Alkalibacillus aidingensis]